MESETDDDHLPEFFHVYIHQHSFHRMLIPREFVKYMGRRKSGSVELVRSSQIWQVELVEVGEDLYFTDGWKNFVKDNLVRDGEFLFFKLHGDLKFSVVIYDESMCEVEVCEQRGNDVVDAGEEGENGVETMLAESLRALQPEAEKTAAPIKPFFEKVVTPHAVTIPKLFLHEHSLSYKSSEMMVLRTSRDSSWQVKIIENDGRVCLSAGWTSFYNKNCFKEGDICKFELLDRLEMMVHVVSREDANLEKVVDVEPSKILPSKRTADKVTNVSTKSLRSSHTKVDRTTDSIKPSFEKRITPFNLVIPQAFLRENSLSYERSELMVLRTGNNSYMEVKIIINDGRIRLSKGWRAFFSENGFKAGDICKFELLDRLEMKVHVVHREEGTVKKKEDVAASNIIPSKRAADRLETVTTASLRSSHPKVDKTTGSVKPSFVKGVTRPSFRIPKAFALEHTLRYKSSEMMVLRTSKNSSSEVKIINENGSIRLSSGWPSFFTENCFKEGDICKFELLNRLEMMVHVVNREEGNINKKVNVA